MKPILGLLLIFVLTYCDKTSPTTFPESPFGKRVFVFSDSMNPTRVQAFIDSLATLQDHKDREFGPNRFALLFKPGNYNLDVYAGYYTSVIGLGKMPSDVSITGRVESREVRQSSLSNFWRSAENLTVIPKGGKNYWVASQASPLRRLHIKGDLGLAKSGYTSGGFIANSVVDGAITSGSQQQFFTRNSNIGFWDGAVWNMMFLGVKNAPQESWPKPPYTTLASTPLIREKPFLFVDEKGDYKIFVPDARTDAQGPDWINGNQQGKTIDFSDVYIVKEDVDNSETINTALQNGKHLVITPGKYYLTETIRVENPNTVILGIGLPSIIPIEGQTAIHIADVEGVTLAGVTFDAGPKRSEVLVEVGKKGTQVRNAQNPTYLFDVFCRVGTDKAGEATSCVIIHSHHVVADHFWLWRADHGPSAGKNRPGWDVNLGENGITVNGDDVTIYGLFVEHFTEYQTVWNGERGRTYFYQSEMPYDPPAQEKWKHGDVDGYASYKVADEVQQHQAWGLGVYNTFQVAPVFAERAIEAPKRAGVRFKHMTTFYLSGKGGGIRHVINDVGNAALENDRQQKVRVYPEE